MCHFELSSLFYGRFSGQKWPFSACFEALFKTIVVKVHNDCHCVSKLASKYLKLTGEQVRITCNRICAFRGHLAHSMADLMVTYTSGLK